MTESIYRGFAQADLEREYNPAANIANVGELHARRRARAAAAQANLSRALDVPYGGSGGQTLDIFFAGRGDAPIQIFFHGGSWKGQDKANYSFIAEPLGAQGIISVNVNYDLCPNVTIDQLIEQCRRAIAWVWANARIMGGDPNRISVCGHSAGAHIACRMLETDWSQYGRTPDDVAKGAMLVSGLYDLEPIRLTATNTDVRLTLEDVVRESPMNRPLRRRAPVFITCGADDNSEFRRQSKDFAAALAGRSYGAQYEEAPGHNHFSILEALADPDHMLGRKMVAIALGA